ncbi:hypothetical protein AB0L70_16475 [Kribbella sp. NPDC051952]|uniref:hypothetical protein n=1 Tax=Kribbella sp. NPDC051952 TaxID=3154851 RepID=UPI0034302666
MNVRRLVLGGAIVVAALGAGGVAYAASDDPTPEQGYVTVDDGATTPTPDCPEKSAENPGGNA